jgi:hypothetical protein
MGSRLPAEMVGMGTTAGAGVLDALPRRRFGVRRSGRGAVPRDDRDAKVLTTLAFAGSTMPGALDYLVQSHHNLLASDAAVRSPLASNAALAINVLLVAFALYVLISRRMNLVDHVSDMILVLTIFGWSLLGLWRENEVTGRAIIDYITVGLVILAVWCLQPSRMLYRHIGRLVAVLIIYSIIFGLTDPGGAFYTSLQGAIGESTKAFIGNNQLASVFGHSNTLGIAVALGIPFLMQLKTRPSRVVLLAAAGWVILWSASRTAIFAAGLALVVVMIVSRMPRLVALALAWAVALTTLTVVFALPLHTTDPDAFTRRGAIWIGSLSEAHQNLALGQGPNWYYDIAQFDNQLGAQASSGHNWFVSTLVVGGAVGMVLGIALLLRLLTAITRGSEGFRTGATAYWYWISIVAISTLEYVWVVSPRGDLFFSVTFVLIALLRIERLAHVRRLSEDPAIEDPDRPAQAELVGASASA